MLRDQAGGPSLRVLAQQVGLGKSQIGAILGGQVRTPPQWPLVRRMVEVCYAHAHQRHRTERLSWRGGLDEYWRPRHTLIEHAFDRRGTSEAATPAPEVPPDPVPQRAAPPVPRQLPSAVAGFTGRDRQLSALDALLGTSTGSTGVTVTIGGSAGVGKTALAIHWARRVRDRFPDGQLYLNLRGHSTDPPLSPAQALARFLRALGIAPDRVPTEVDEAAALFRTLVADRRLLVLLDNAAGPDQVRPLLPASPHCVVLVTSRERLGGLVASDGARPLTLDVLDDAEARALLVAALGPARAEADPAAVRDLARLCGRLPLALRIAAANLVTRPHTATARFVADLRAGNRIADLTVTGDERTAVRAAFDLSYATLGETERRVFRLLGHVPAPDVATAAVCALTGLAPAATTGALRRLQDAHLVDEPAAGRHTLHDLLRHYARSLTDGAAEHRDAADALDRLHAFYLNATDAAADLLYGWTVRLPAPEEPVDAARPTLPFPDAAAALDWLDAERANLVALVCHAAERGPREVAWRLADNLRGYFFLRRGFVDWLAVAHAARRAADGRPGPMAAADLSLGVAYASIGRYSAAITHYTASLTLAGRAGWTAGRAAALNNVGTALSQTGRLREAAGRFTEAIEAHERAGNPGQQAVALDNLGIVRRELGDLDAAATLHRKAIVLHHESGSPYGHATALDNLAAVFLDGGRPDEAMEHFRAALALHRRAGDRGRVAACLRGIAEAHCRAGRARSAVRPAREALALTTVIGDRRAQAQSLVTLATVEQELGLRATAADRFLDALRLAGDTDCRHVQARALIGVSRARVDLGRPADADGPLREALRLVRANGYRVLEAEALAVRARINAART
ncbi:ATP-binding protein [Virgisporangium aliadipatigenens]|uniref:ATP-binding protein n=1 Tax=Virgisporangium aliadipatigenens TaxID=741659 RepID=UPI001940DF3B|nr:tetratricopeptide repeat protein [Virgisporangium aliadipatigenens]